MNWKLWLGHIRSGAEQRLIRLNNGFIKRNYPYGRNWIFDLKRMVKSVQVIVDAGANVGSVALELNYTFPLAAVFAFEPVKSTYEKLVYNTGSKPNIKPFALALGAEKTEMEITLQPDDTNNSLVKSAPGSSGLTELIQVARLDDFTHEKGIHNIDILKIDVEGYENAVLLGCEKLLNRGAIKCICLEAGYERMASKTHFSDIENLMEKYGFQLCGIYNLQRNMYDKRQLWYSDNLYIHKSVLQA